MTDFAASNWRKSTRSGTEHGNCVEVGSNRHSFGIRDTKDRDAGTIVLSRASFQALLTGLRV